MSDYPFFSRAELTCRCGCGRADMDAEFMARLVRLRKALGFPFPVASAFRCATHNQRVSSTGAKGPHTTGRAIDIRVSGSLAFELVEGAIEHGFTGIGVRQSGPHPGRFIHLDDLDGPIRPWLWTY